MIDDPLALLADMLPGVPGDDGYFPVMALASVDDRGDPDVRTVLLSRLSAAGLAFHTDSMSRKVEQLLRHPGAALMLTVPEQGRQIVVRGVAARQTEPDLSSAYQARSRYLQILAWMNTTEMAAQPELERRRRWAAFAVAHPEGTLTTPPDWAGFLVDPRRITFWQADTEGPSHRIVCTRTASGWVRRELPG